MANTSCPGCSGSLKPLDTDSRLGVCSHCGGLVSIETIPRSLACLYVAMNKAMKADSNTTRYFDFDVRYPDGHEDRVHGWFDPNDKLVVQYG